MSRMNMPPLQLVIDSVSDAFSYEMFLTPFFHFLSQSRDAFSLLVYRRIRKMIMIVRKALTSPNTGQSGLSSTDVIIKASVS